MRMDGELGPFQTLSTRSAPWKTSHCRVRNPLQKAGLESSLSLIHTRGRGCAAVRVEYPGFYGENLDSLSLNKFAFVTHP